jgi:hypothetical protein
MAMIWPKEIIAFTSPPGVVMYPHVFERNPEVDDSGKYAFGVMLRFKKETVDAGGEFHEEWKAMRREFMRCAKIAWPGGLPEEMGSPVRDGDKFDKANNKKKKDELRGHYYINFKSPGNEDQKSLESQPTIVDANRGLAEITSRREFYPGCVAAVSGTVFPYDNKGNEGVGVRLTNICKIDDGDRIGGRPDAKEQFAKFGKGTRRNDSDADDLL